MSAEDLMNELYTIADPVRAKTSQWFFKTGKGEYGEGDEFIGIRMPEIRRICKKYRSLTISELRKLLASPIHEIRMSAVIIMADIFQKSDSTTKQNLYDLYIKSVKNNRINNWDLIDVSAPRVVGEYFFSNGTDEMYMLANSDHLWSKRTAVLSTASFLKRNDASHTMTIAEILLHDSHDLIQKAVGWFLREAGKRVNEKVLTDFLDQHAHEMPRTMLRYSIEKLSSEQKIKYMTK